MLQYERIDVLEGIALTKTSKSKECIICHYWYFNTGFKLQPLVCNGCHHMSMMVYNLSDFKILTVNGVDYRCISWNLNKNDTIGLMYNSKLEKKAHYKWILVQVNYLLK